MKIIQEFKLLNSTNSFSLFRIPVKNFNPTFISHKPISKYTEISISFPSKNSSAYKSKMNNSNHLDFKSIPISVNQYYYCNLNFNKDNNDKDNVTKNVIILSKIHLFYLFSPIHQYYSVEKDSKLLRKAESREEIENRKKSINFKLKNIENEEFKILTFDNNYKRVDLHFDDNFTKRVDNNFTERFDNNFTKRVDNNFTERVEKAIFEARIVDPIVLYKSICNSNSNITVNDNNSAVLIRNILHKMTHKLCNKFILKNKFYEKSLLEKRNKMIDMFDRFKCINYSDTEFMQDEIWMIEEIADLKEGKYILKGEEYVRIKNNNYTSNNYASNTLMNNTHINNSTLMNNNTYMNNTYTSNINNYLSPENIAFWFNLDFENTYKETINDLLDIEFMLSSFALSQKSGIDEDTIIYICSNNEYYHLSNNKYIHKNERNSKIEEILSLFVNRKTASLVQIDSIIDGDKSKFTELLKYAELKGMKYYLK